MPGSDSFVRVPTQLLTMLFQTPLSGTQLRILLWVIRQTYGWNRQEVRFTWYRMAKELRVSRPATYRAGQALLTAGILIVQNQQISVQREFRFWGDGRSPQMPFGGRQLWIEGIAVNSQQRRTLPPNNAGVADEQQDRCHTATVFRRRKESSKDSLKTSIDSHLQTAGDMGYGKKPHGEKRDVPTAGAARPIPGKYDGLSQN